MRWAMCLMFLLSTTLYAREMRIECPTFLDDRARCEIHGLPMARIHWRTFINERIAEHVKGIVVYLTLDTQWRRLEVSVGKTVLFNVYVRFNGKQVVFRRPP